MNESPRLRDSSHQLPDLCALVEDLEQHRALSLAIHEPKNPDHNSSLASAAVRGFHTEF
jgi:hypothetical protein